MKDQRSLDDSPTSYEKWDRAKTIVLESLHKPDPALRSCAHNQECYDDVMQIREQVIELVTRMINPRKYIED
jgi:hypothetical protein